MAKDIDFCVFRNDYFYDFAQIFIHIGSGHAEQNGLTSPFLLPPIHVHRLLGILQSFEVLINILVPQNILPQRILHLEKYRIHYLKQMKMEKSVCYILSKRYQNNI